MVDGEVEKAEDARFEVFQENWEAVRLFVRCATQWRMGPGGATGLDYMAVFRIMDLYAIPEQQDTFERLQVMEEAALKKLNKG